MLEFPRWKVIWLWAVTLFFAAASLPSILSVAGLPWPSALPAPRVNLGLDLAGWYQFGVGMRTDSKSANLGRMPFDWLGMTASVFLWL